MIFWISYWFIKPQCYLSVKSTYNSLGVDEVFLNLQMHHGCFKYFKLLSCKAGCFQNVLDMMKNKNVEFLSLVVCT